MSDQQILEILKLANAPEQAKKQGLGQVKYIVELRVAGILQMSMSDEQKSTFEKLQEESTEVVWTWLNENFVNTSELYEEVLKDYLKSLQDRL